MQKILIIKKNNTILFTIDIVDNKLDNLFKEKTINDISYIFIESNEQEILIPKDLFKDYTFIISTKQQKTNIKYEF